MNDVARHRFEELKAGGLLPSPRGVAMSVLEVTSRPNVAIHDVTRLVQIDPAMAGRILRYANAVHGGALRHIASLHHAITFLGLFRVRQIALGFSLIDHYRSGACKEFDYVGYWTTSLATAIAAQKLATQAQSPPDESFTCGLLAGIGRLALATTFPKKYGELLRLGLSGKELAKEEIGRFGIDHAQLSAEMLTGWGLPDIFTGAVRHHEEPAEAPFAPGSRALALAAALHFAARIGQLLNLDETGRWEKVPSLFHAAARLGVEAAEVPPLVEEVVAGWQGWAKELDLPTRSYSDLKALLAAPPSAASDSDGAPLVIASLRVALLMEESARQQELAATLLALGLRVETGADADWQGLPPDAVIVDLGADTTAALQRLRELRAVAGNSIHVIALIPATAEGGVAQLLLAGASDYLLYDYTEAALVARLSNAQQLVSLRGAVRAERELAVSSSGDWARANRRLLHEALTDPLTQLPNRRYGLDRFAQEWSIALSNAQPIACMMLDIDHFKRVNDEHGHDVGDIVLQQVAAAVERDCRRSDVVFRYGGEEFCCICPNTGLNEALLLAERIVSTMRGGRYGRAEDSFPLTLSIGVAVQGKDTADPAALIAKADGALYAAKHGGRDRVTAA